jgi:hypothetical protein
MLGAFLCCTTGPGVGANADRCVRLQIDCYDYLLPDFHVKASPPKLRCPRCLRWSLHGDGVCKALKHLHSLEKIVYLYHSKFTCPGCPALQQKEVVAQGAAKPGDTPAGAQCWPTWGTCAHMAVIFAPAWNYFFYGANHILSLGTPLLACSKIPQAWSHPRCCLGDAMGMLTITPVRLLMRLLPCPPPLVSASGAMPGSCLG